MLPSLYIRLISCLKQSIQEATLSENSYAVTWFDSLRRSFMGGAVHLCFSTQILMHAFFPLLSLILVYFGFRAVGRTSNTVA